GEAAVGLAFDRRVERNLLAGPAADGVIPDGEAVGALLDAELADGRGVGAPVLVAYQEGDRAQDLDPLHRQVAELAAVELDRHRAGGQDAAGDVGLFGAAQRDGARGGCWLHRGLLQPDPVFTPSPLPSRSRGRRSAASCRRRRRWAGCRARTWPRSWPRSSTGRRSSESPARCRWSPRCGSGPGRTGTRSTRTRT